MQWTVWKVPGRKLGEDKRNLVKYLSFCAVKFRTAFPSRVRWSSEQGLNESLLKLLMYLRVAIKTVLYCLVQCGRAQQGAGQDRRISVLPSLSEILIKLKFLEGRIFFQ